MYNINNWMIVKSSKRGYNSTSTVKTPMPGTSPANIPPKTPNRNNNNSIVIFYNNFNLNASGESHTRLGPLQLCCLSLSVLGGQFFADVTNGVANIFSEVFYIVYKDEYKLLSNIV